MKSILLALSLLSFTAAAAEGSDTLLLERTYKVRVQAGTFSCSEPNPPNGHNYPVYTYLTFELPSFDLWLSDVWTNVDRYTLANNYEPCSTYKNLLRPAPQQDLIGVVTQRITERYHLSGDKKDCMRATREEAELLVDGVKLSGVNEFLVGPVKAELCR